MRKAPPAAVKARSGPRVCSAAELRPGRGLLYLPPAFEQDQTPDMTTQSTHRKRGPPNRPKAPEDLAVRALPAPTGSAQPSVLKPLRRAKLANGRCTSLYGRHTGRSVSARSKSGNQIKRSRRRKPRPERTWRRPAAPRPSRPRRHQPATRRRGDPGQHCQQGQRARPERPAGRRRRYHRWCE